MKSSTKNSGNKEKAEATVCFDLPECHVKNAFFVMVNGFYTKVRHEEILWLESYHNYLDLHLKGDQKLCIIHPLSKMEEILPKHLFIRIHRSVIINVNAVERFIGNTVYIGKRHLDVSRPYRQTLFSCFDILKRKRKPEKQPDHIHGQHSLADNKFSRV